jgi:hypothetical protein
MRLSPPYIHQTQEWVNKQQVLGAIVFSSLWGMGMPRRYSFAREP